jgi:hypothetical protein
MFSQKNPVAPLVKGELSIQKIEPSCIKNLDSTSSGGL